MRVSKMSFPALTAAIAIAAALVPSNVRAQSGSKYADATIVVATTRDGDEGLHFATRNCSGTLSGTGIFIDFGDGCWAWNTGGGTPRSMYARLESGKISFRHNGDDYVITDAATLKQARDLFAPVADIMEQQRELGEKQRALGSKQRDLGEQQREVKVRVPDMSADFAKVEADAKRLASQGGTQSDLGDLQSELGDLQSRIGDLQSQAGDMQSKLGDQQSVLGDQQSEMGDRQSALSEKAEGLAKDEVVKLSTLLDDAVRNGTAKKQ